VVFDSYGILRGAHGRKNMKNAVALSLAVGLLAGVSAKADPIVLYNTGVGPGGLLAEGASNPNWTVSPSGAGNGTTAVLSAGNRYFQWIANSAASSWIGTADVQNTGGPGNYSFTQSFSLAGFDPTTATISGRWAGDDTLINILINGTAVGTDGNGGGSIPGTGAWTDWHSFNIAAGNAAFTSGTNTITFVINNADNFYEGVRVELSGTARLVPSPSVAGLLALAGVGAARRRR
jgi:hypothetical protein